jgi:hypothetical protein
MQGVILEELVGSPFGGQRSDQLIAPDPALGDDLAIDQHHRDPEVVQAVQFVLGVDVAQLGVDAEFLE